MALRTEAIGQGLIQAPDLLAPHLRAAALAQGSQVLLLHSQEEEGEEVVSLAMGAMNLIALMLMGEGLKDTTLERALKEVRVVDLEEEGDSGGASVMLSEVDFLRATGEGSVMIMEVILMEQEAGGVQGDLWAHEDPGEGPGGEVVGRGEVFGRSVKNIRVSPTSP